MDTNENPKVDRTIDRILGSLKKEYVIMGSTHVKAWQAWLLVGLAAGILIGIILVANRGGEFEAGKASVGVISGRFIDEVLRESQWKKLGLGTPRPGSVPAFTWTSDGEKTIITAPGQKAVELPTPLDGVSPDGFINRHAGYIIQLKSAPLAAQYAALSRDINALKNQLRVETATTAQATLKQQMSQLQTARKTQLAQYLLTLSQEQARAEQSIRAIVPSAVIVRKFSRSFNGLEARISDTDAKKLQNAGFRVWTNQELRAVLMDSVPLIGADQVWQLQDPGGQYVTGKGITIAIIDTGVDYTHPDLGGCFGPNCKVAEGYDIVNNDADPMDDMGHGTHVASIAAGNGALKGVAPDAVIYAYKVLDNQGFGSWSWVIDGIDRALDPNQDGDLSDMANVMNLSLGGPGDPDDPVSQAVDNAVKAGSIVAVAAGNSGPMLGTIGSPGAAREAITVGATDKGDLLAPFSSAGPVKWNNQVLMKPDIVAPGVSICAARWDSLLPGYECFDGQHIAISGTSMATPHIAGAIALLKQKNPSWTPQEVKWMLQRTAKNVGTNPLLFGAGRVDILKAAQTPLIPYDATSAIQSPGSIRGGAYDIQGAVNANQFMGYTIEIGQALPGVQNITFSQIFQSSTLPSTGYLARSLTAPQHYGRYLLRLMVTFSDRSSTIKYTEFFNYSGTDFTLMPGWPQSPFQFGSGFWGVGSTPIVYDLDNDGKKEIITFSMNQVTVWRSDGSLMPGWPKVIDVRTLSNGPLSPPSVGDIDGDGRPEIVQPNYYLGLVNGKMCGYAWESDGSPVKGWFNDCSAPLSELNMTNGISTLYDVDGDGKQDIIFHTNRYAIYPDNGAVYVVRGDSSIAPGWPVMYKNTSRPYSSQPAVGDIDDDGKPEIVTAFSSSDGTGFFSTEVALYNADGSEKRRFDVEGNAYPDNFILADVDGDGKMEIGYPSIKKNIVFYEDTGSITAGWPFLDSNNEKYLITPTDLFGDKSIKVIFPYATPSYDYFISVIDAGAKVLPGWPQRTIGAVFWERPQTADITGDSLPDILTTTGFGFVYAWQKDGTLIPNFPLEMDGPSHSGVAVDDIDNDGILELVAGLHNGTVYVWKLNGVPYDQKNVSYWPMWKHDPRNSGLLVEFLPDLTPVNGTLTKWLIGYTYRVLVSNTGVKDSGSWEFQVKTTGDSLARTKTFGSIKPGGTVMVKGIVLKYPVTFTVDPKNSITELNEKNNSFTISAPTLSPLPETVQVLEGP